MTMTLDVTKMSDRDIKEMLVDTYGFEKSVLTGKKGKTLAEILAQQIDANGPPEQEEFEENLDDFEPVDEEVGEAAIDDSPRRGEVGWTDYVLAELQANEQVDGNPTCSGLRRLVEKFIGEIISSKTAVVAAPSQMNDNRATVVVSLCVEGFDNLLREVDGAADCCVSNTDAPYNRFPTATAETMAESRALRRILRLNKVVSAEEVSLNAREPEENLVNTENDDITRTQIRFLEVMAQKSKVNIKKVVHKHHPDVNNIKELSYKESKALQEVFASFQREAPPEDIIGYDENWRAEFC